MPSSVISFVVQKTNTTESPQLLLLNFRLRMQSIENLVRRFGAEIPIAKVADARNHVEFLVDLGIEGGGDDLYLLDDKYLVLIQNNIC